MIHIKDEGLKEKLGGVPVITFCIPKVKWKSIKIKHKSYSWG